MKNNNESLIECVPNFSEGRDEKKIEAIADSIRSVEGVKLLHIDKSPAANRTVMTFAGAPKPLVEAAFQAIKKASEVIDMTQQQGVHPRIGATDVCPLVPLKNITMDEVVHCSKLLGERVGKELNIPVYLYEHSAMENYRKPLPNIRKGQYENFAEKIKDKKWQPDYGPLHFNLKTGATVIGARAILVAFNIALDTQDVTIANKIAGKIRESGFVKESNANPVKVKGILAKLRAIGWYMEDYKKAQVSFNLLDYNTTSPLKVWQTCKALAEEEDTKLLGSEVIGLIPESCVWEAGKFAIAQEDDLFLNNESFLIRRGIEYLGLDKLKPFEPQEKILEYALANAQLF